MTFSTGLAAAGFVLGLAAIISLYGVFFQTTRRRAVWQILLWCFSAAAVVLLLRGIGSSKLFWVLAAATLLCLGVVTGTKQNWTLTPMQVFTLGVFLSVYLYFFPVCLKSGELPGWLCYGESFHRTLRVFVLDTSFQDIVTALADETESLRNTYQTMGVALCVLAPVLLFGNLLMLFRDLWSELRFFGVTFSPIYIFSELNAKSVALAEDIVRKPPRTKYRKLRRWILPPVIVFTDVYVQNQEQDQELLARAGAMRAICLKKDVAQLDFYRKWSRVEIFLMGEKEEENMSQAMAIMEMLQKHGKKKVQLYVFSRKESDGCILDSLEYGILNKALYDRTGKLVWQEKKDGKKLTDEQKWKLELDARYQFTLQDGKSFSLRRVDVVQHLIWMTVPKLKLLTKAKKNGGELSVLILGFGSYGQEFFKMLIWYCQFEGVRLNLTVVDQQKEPGLRTLIERQCPELLSFNRVAINGEAHYDIELLSGVDMRSGTFARMISGTDWLAARLQKTDVAFVSMGDDDLNVETAMYLRTLMDRVKGFTVTEKTTVEQEPVQILAVVFDEVKSKLLRAEEKNLDKETEEGFFLKNHSEQKLHIRFIGGLREQFCYDWINWQAQEEGAYRKHRGWVEVEEKIKIEKGQKKPMPSGSARQITENEQEERLKYHKYEYYRQSSIAKHLYSEGVLEESYGFVTCLKKGHQTCTCENCIRRKKSEHKRWNAYMRIYGWCLGAKSNRAKLHKDLVPWDMLSPEDQLKD